MAATSFTVHSDGSITAYSPAEGMGMVNIRVETPDGTSAIDGDVMAQFWQRRQKAATDQRCCRPPS